MTDLNFFFIFWFLMVFALILVELIAKFDRFVLSKWIQELFVYGKAKKLRDLETKNDVKSTFIDLFVNSLQVPKRFFMHFYFFAFVLQTIILILYFSIDQKLFHQLVNLNRLIFSSKSMNFLASTSKEQTILAYVFLQIQIIRRFYENKSVSIFSNTTIHLVHYLLGYLFYLSINLLEFNLLFREKDQQSESINYLSLIIGTLIFSSGFIIEHISLIQFASLRSKNKISTLNQHFIPTGSMFDTLNISCPHYFGELLIYLGITILLQGYLNMFIILLWTLLLHINMASQSHNWYLKKFGQNYPNNRKALLPFVM